MQRGQCPAHGLPWSPGKLGGEEGMHSAVQLLQQHQQPDRASVASLPPTAHTLQQTHHNKQPYQPSQRSLPIHVLGMQTVVCGSNALVAASAVPRRVPFTLTRCVACCGTRIDRCIAVQSSIRSPYTHHLVYTTPHVRIHDVLGRVSCGLPTPSGVCWFALTPRPPPPPPFSLFSLFTHHLCRRRVPAGRDCCHCCCERCDLAAVHC
jgi:hypothetical protein